MKSFSGYTSSPLWLIGDSEPERWRDKLDHPLDSRHPIRHNIWTSVLDVVQDKVYRALGRRIDSEKLYVRNAVEDPADKGAVKDSVNWNNECIEKKLDELRRLLSEHEYKPKILLSFGAFSFEFCRRALEENEPRKFSYWDTEKLGNEFKKRAEAYSPEDVNLIPLLHRSIAGGRFIGSHRVFVNGKGCAKDDFPNYFNYTGEKLAGVLVKHAPDFNSLWVVGSSPD